VNEGEALDCGLTPLVPEGWYGTAREQAAVSQVSRMLTRDTVSAPQFTAKGENTI